MPALNQVPLALLGVVDFTALGEVAGEPVADGPVGEPVADGPAQLTRTRKSGTHQRFTVT